MEERNSCETPCSQTYIKCDKRGIPKRKARKHLYTYLTCREHIPQILTQQAGNKFLQVLSLALFQFSSGTVGHRPREEHTAVRKQTLLQNAGRYQIIQRNSNFLHKTDAFCLMIGDIYYQQWGRITTSLYFINS